MTYPYIVGEIPDNSNTCKSYRPLSMAHLPITFNVHFKAINTDCSLPSLHQIPPSYRIRFLWQHVGVKCEGGLRKINLHLATKLTLKVFYLVVHCRISLEGSSLRLETYALPAQHLDRSSLGQHLLDRQECDAFCTV